MEGRRTRVNEHRDSNELDRVIMCRYNYNYNYDYDYSWFISGPGLEKRRLPCVVVLVTRRVILPHKMEEENG